MEKTNSNSLLNGSSRMLWAFVGGAASGAALAYFTSPRSGPENRRALRETVDNSVASVKNLPSVIRETSASIADSTKRRLSRNNEQTNGDSKYLALEVSSPETAPSLTGNEQ